MAKKKKAGKRYPNGRLRHPTAAERAETDFETRRPVLERLCRHAGIINPTHADLMRAKRAGSTVAGRYWLARLITEREFNAAEKFAEMRAAWIREMDLPPETPKGADLLGAGGRSVAVMVRTTRHPAIDAYDDLRHALGEKHLSTMLALNVGMYVRKEPLKAALAAAVKHLGV